MDKRKRLSNECIIRASQGDPTAIQQVLDFYTPYINTIAAEWKEITDSKGRYVLNTDRSSYIQTHLIEVIKKWRAK